MMRLEEHIQETLQAASTLKHKAFMEKLIPGCHAIQGVKMGVIRQLVKAILKQDYKAYLAQTTPATFEETMVRGLVIANMKDPLEEKWPYVESFVPYITNWSLCDSFCMDLKSIRKKREEVWDKLIPYWQSDEPYAIRFAVVIMLAHYNEEAYLPRLFEVFDTIAHEDYYVKMAVAWAVSMCFVHHPEMTMPYLEHNQLDEETHNKSIQKIRESLRVDQEMKAYLLTKKR